LKPSTRNVPTAGPGRRTGGVRARLERAWRLCALGPLLALAVSLAQFGAVSHEFGHAVEALARAGHPQPSDAPGLHAACGLCIAFAHVATGLGARALALALAPSAPPRSGVPAVALAERHAPGARSRGPPDLR
jgi:hypothetical protein